ncbi:hypothetical protein G6O69_39145, partial [Pseudenhygromyxa sp. WMMC2535]|uniref:hypothetical protein n=1 Tax=Pseudenhygromyxa sp. WMMC2535 TaxID=2712867 RepID=UPI0015950519
VPEWVCSQYNDFFVALLDSQAVDNPSDKNIAIYDDNGDQWPVGLNILKAAPGLFRSCESGYVGCQGDLAEHRRRQRLGPPPRSSTRPTSPPAAPWRRTTRAC